MSTKSLTKAPFLLVYVRYHWPLQETCFNNVGAREQKVYISAVAHHSSSRHHTKIASVYSHVFLSSKKFTSAELNQRALVGKSVAVFPGIGDNTTEQAINATRRYQLFYQVTKSQDTCWIFSLHSYCQWVHFILCIM